MSRARVLGFVLLLSVAAFLTPARAAEPTVIKWSAAEGMPDCEVWLIDPSTGNLLAVGPQNDTLWLLPAARFDGKDVPAVKGVLRTPTKSLQWKMYKTQGYLLSLAQDGGTVTVLNATTLAEVKTLKLPAPGTSLGSGDDPDDPRAFVAMRAVGEPARLGTLNFETFAFSEAGRLTEYLDEGARIEVSADGATLYAWRSSVSSSGRFAFRIKTAEGGRTEVEQLAHHHASMGQLIADPLGEFVIVHASSSNALVYRRDLDAEVGKIPHRVHGFVPGHAAVLGLQTPTARARGASDAGPHVQLVVTSLKDFQEIGRVNLPAASTTEGRLLRDYGRVYVDPCNKRVLLLGPRRAPSPVTIVVPLSALPGNMEPRLRAVLAVPASALVGEELALPIKTIPATAQVKLASGPSGMRIEGGKLRWTPTGDAVGANTVSPCRSPWTRRNGGATTSSTCTARGSPWVSAHKPWS